MKTTYEEGLKRELGVFDVAINVINISIASGIFLLPALIAGILGNASIIAYGLCGLMFLLVTLCYAEVGSRITTSGGAYAYIEKAFGSYFGFLANTFLWFGTGVLAAAALVNGIADMLSVPFPIFNYGLYRALLFLSIFSFLAFSNVIGVKQGMKLVKTITLIKILPLVILIIVGLLNIKTENLAWQGFPTLDKLGPASLILFFAFTGGETALNISGEMKNPNRTAPLGLLFGVITIVVFYCLIQIVAQSTLGIDLTNQKAPLAAAAGILLGNWGSTMMISCAVIAIFGSLNSFILVFPRAMFAGANDGLLPRFLSNVHPKYATPHWAIIIFTAISFILAISGGFKQLLILATLSMMLLHVGVVLAAIKFRWQKEVGNATDFRLPGGIIIPFAALIILLWFVFQSKPNEVIGTGVFILVLTIVYFLKRFFKNDKS
jgi:basic amino acid/polyamine antiporter, APA family